MASRVRVSAHSLHEWFKNNFPYGEIGGAMSAAASYLIHQDAEHVRFYEKSKRHEVLEVSTSQLYALADHLSIADKEKFVGAAVISKQQSRVLPTGDSARSEIEVLIWGDNVLADQKYHPTNRYLAVYVDDVQFRQRDQDGVVIKKGKYIRIEVPSGLPGAIVLPVDVKSGDVLLVTQYRHPQRRFLTEAPRGFGMLGVDFEAVDTARREMAEEAGALPLKNLKGVEEIYFLRSLYTDTGKLSEAPHYFLAFVDRRLQLEKLNRQEPTMEDPIWVSLSAFYRAIEGRGAIALKPNEYEFCLNTNYRQKLKAHTDLDDGILQIEDAFTCLVAFLAKPILQQKFPC